MQTPGRGLYTHYDPYRLHTIPYTINYYYDGVRRFAFHKFNVASSISYLLL
jgi:hypothetical protein